MAKGKYARKRLLKKLRTVPISSTELSPRVVNLLANAEIHNLAKLYLFDEERLRSISGIGEKAIKEIQMIDYRSYII